MTTLNDAIEQCEQSLGTLFGNGTVFNAEKLEESGEIHYIIKRKFDGFQVSFEVHCKGKLHRKAGPALIRFRLMSGGGAIDKEWWEDGFFVRSETNYCP